MAVFGPVCFQHRGAFSAVADGGVGLAKSAACQTHPVARDRRHRDSHPAIGHCHSVVDPARGAFRIAAHAPRISADYLPILSALPQELIFRPLFFHRYRQILPAGHSAIAVNAAIFSFAHLMYWSWVVALMTFIGGWFFARGYHRHGFLAAWALHSVAGNVLFATGMGYYFYSGNVVRPF